MDRLEMREWNNGGDGWSDWVRLGNLIDFSANPNCFTDYIASLFKSQLESEVTELPILETLVLTFSEGSQQEIRLVRD